MWLSGKEAGEYIEMSRDYVEDRAVPWPDDDAYVPYKVRYQYIVGKKGADPVRRYYRPDLDALIVKPSALRRGPVTLRPLQFRQWGGVSENACRRAFRPHRLV